METKNNNRIESRSKDFATFLKTAANCEQSCSYLVLAGKLEDWLSHYRDVMRRDWREGEPNNTIAESIEAIQHQLIYLFADLLFDKAIIDYDSSEL